MAALIVPPTPKPPVTPSGSIALDTSTLPAAITHAATKDAPLLSPWVPALLLVALLAAIGMWVARVVDRHRRGAPPPRHRVLLAGSAGAGCLFLAMLTTASAINVYAGYLPTLASVWHFVAHDDVVPVASDATTAQALQRTPEGAHAVAAGDTSWHVTGREVGGGGLGFRSRTVVIATPPGYSTSAASYPVIYLVGGYPGGADDWFQTGQVTRTVDALVAAGRMPFPILVEPDVNGSYTTDSEGLNAVGGPQVETWLTRDVVGFMDRSYRTLADRGHRVLAGMSSGGFVALNDALRNQDVFGIALGLEPYGDPGNVTTRLLGGDVGLLHRNSPQYYAPALPLHRQLSIYLDVGSRTGDVARVQSLARIFHDRGLDVVMRTESGQGHTWAEATAGMPYALAFAASRLGVPALAQTFDTSAFPRSHRDRFSLLPEDDAQRQREHRLRCAAHAAACQAAGQPAGSGSAP